MKPNNNNNNYNRRYLLSQSSVSDHSFSVVCHHRSALKEIAREQSLVTQLRAIVLPALQADERSEVVAQMFESILDCSRKAVAELKLHQFDADRADDVLLVDDKKRVRKISDNCNTKEENAAKPHRQHKRRRFASCLTLETPVPHYDGHQWRKYGQKHINNAKHPRSYYRCTYRQEENCKATKTVQQQDDSTSSSADHPVMYTVVYYGQHSCKGNIDGEDSAPGVVEIASTQRQSSGELAQSDSQGSISATCSVADDHQTSLESELPDMPDLTTEVNQYELFDVTAYAPLDLGTWEMDVHGHGLVEFGDW